MSAVVSAPGPKPASVLILGSGPVVIGQAAEFDYAGTQACRALRAEGVRTILVNSQPGHDHDRPARRRRDLPRAADRRGGRGGHRRASAGGPAGRPRRPDRAEPRDGAGRGRRLRAPPRSGCSARRSRRSRWPRTARRSATCSTGSASRTRRAAIVEGATPEARDGLGRRGARRRSACRPSSGRRSRSAAPAAASSRPRRPTASGSGPACAPARSARSWSSAASSAGRRSSTRSCATPTTRASPSARWRTSTRSASTPATRSSSRPVQTLTDAVHQRLRSAALAIIRALGVEGGCNVQFALSPDSTEYAVIEVNPRVSRSSALASKATGYPIARVAAQIAVGRRLAEIPNVVTGTTVAAFEPALDYVVVKLPRFPFDKFPTADRTLGSQMKATGEVMAIDRTFGSALNKALRGLEQAGAGPLAEDPSWTPDVRLPRRRSTAATRDDDEPIRWVDEAGQACESTRHAQRTAAPDRPAPVPRAVRLAAVAAARPAPARRPGGGRSSEATGIAPWFLAEMGRNVALEARGRGDRAAARRPGATPRPPTLLATVKRAGFGDRELAGAGRHDRRTSSGRPGSRSACGPGYAMVDTCAAEFAAETPYFYSTYAAAGSAPEAPPVARPAALVIGSGPVRIGQGIEFDYCAVQAADTLRGAGWQAVMINSNPETVSTDFDASSRLYFEPLDPESVRSVIEAETRRRRRTSCRRSSRTAARRRSTSPRRWPPAASRCSASTSRRSTRPRSGRASRRCSTGSASRSPRAAWPTASRRR